MCCLDCRTRSTTASVWFSNFAGRSCDRSEQTAGWGYPKRIVSLRQWRWALVSVAAPKWPQPGDNAKDAMEASPKF